MCYIVGVEQPSNNQGWSDVLHFKCG